jgi:hypothetical protein
MPELRFESPAALMHEDEVVAIGIFVEVGHLLDGAAERKDHIVVEHQLDAPGDGVALGGHLLRAEMAMLQNRFIQRLDGARVAQMELFDPRRRIVVIQDRLDAGEALRAQHLLCIESAIWSAELDMPLRRHLSHAYIPRHCGYLPCS